MFSQKIKKFQIMGPLIKPGMIKPGEKPCVEGLTPRAFPDYLKGEGVFVLNTKSET